MKTTHFFIFLFVLIGINKSSSQTFFGNGTGTGNQGLSNSAFGANSLSSSTLTGSQNTSLGDRNLVNNSSGSGNLAVGYQSLVLNTTGINNIAVGYNCLKDANGNNNIAIGERAGNHLNSGSNNILIGSYSGLNLSNGDNNVFIGNISLDTTGNPDYAQSGTSGAIILAAGGGGGTVKQKLFITNTGYTGIALGNNKIPKNRLELNSAGAVAGTSGLRFRGYNSSSSPVASNGRVLTLNTDGDVVLTTDQGSGGSTIINAGANVTVTGTGTPASPYLISSTAANCNLFDCDGTLNTTTAGSPTIGLRTVTMGDNNLFFQTNTNNDGNGRVYIGSSITNNGSSSGFPAISATSQFRLLVEGGVLSERVKVSLRSTANWADYVFADNYKLMPLNEVEAFVKENNHLPGIESAEILSKAGLDLGEMQAKQMAKIEELTLYVIQQNKEIEELKAQMKALLEKK